MVASAVWKVWEGVSGWMRGSGGEEKEGEAGAGCL